MLRVNPQMLAWARKRTGQSVDDVAIAMKRTAEEIRAWESGRSSPTYPQLERLAYSVYKRPIAVFFFPEPPEEVDPEQSFRTLPAFELENLAPDTRFALREAQAAQFALEDLTGGANPAQRVIFKDLLLRPGQATAPQARRVRSYLGISLEEQRSWHDSDYALRRWRDCVQDVGIFVFKRSFEQAEVSGFCLLHSEFPVVYINNGSSKNRQIFTLFHELAHILVQSAGITKVRDDFVSVLSGRSKTIEVFCNAFAAECLVPREAVSSIDPLDDSQIAGVAQAFSVSREVILRRFVDMGLVDSDYYAAKVTEWNAEPRGQRGSGGNYYLTQAAYLGDHFLRLAFRAYYSNQVSAEQLADYLKVKPRNLRGLEELVSRR